MGPTPIPPHVVHTIFQYVLPPSLPLPPHLLSKPLTERHHFLSIPPTDATRYLCWPSSHAADVTEALARGVSDPITSEPEHQVRYTAPDEDTVLAHVRPDAQSPLQIVFTWDAETASWRYHDARMLPFPEASLPSLDAALSSAPNGPSALEGFIDQPAASHGPRSDSPASDNYWAGYESSGSSPDTSALPPSVPLEEDHKAEAAYWASYAAVHGSGDSTVPSPRLEKRRLASEKLPDARSSETTDPLVAHLHLRLQQENGFLSPRFSRPQYDSNSGKSKETPINERVRQEYSKRIGNGQLLHDEYGFPKDDGMEAVDGASEQMRESPKGVVKTGTRGDREDGVREAIRGIYRLWKAQSGSEDAESFLDIVKDSLYT
ncbi:hypothetical protein JB92DRAFT_3144595 [Gautieria morchelliformis]|nr:hypothetical protein JB92DRAFT_3144595 [Gautieria morchelliformis]